MCLLLYSQVQEECYMALCDTLVMYSPQLARTCPVLKPLVQTASEALVRSLLHFITENVFIYIDDDEGLFEKPVCNFYYFLMKQGCHKVNKNKKRQNKGKNRGFLKKKSGNLKKFEKVLDFVCFNLKNFLF